MRRILSALLFSLLIVWAPFVTGERIQESQRLTITDSLNRKVTIPAKVKRVLSLNPEITRIVLALGRAGALVGKDHFIHHYDHLFDEIYPQGRGLPVVSMKEADVKVELVLQLDPDVIFASPSEAHIPDALQNKVKKPVAALSSQGKFDNLLEQIRLTGEILDARERASGLISYFKKGIDEVKDAVASVPEEARPSVYLTFWSSLNRTPVFYEPVNTAGGRNLAEQLLPMSLGSPGTVVSIEKIIGWNPDIILVHGNELPKKRAVTVEGILSDSRFRSVRAVSEGKVFYTFGYWYWWDPAQVLVEVLYLARLFHPLLFEDMDLEKRGNEIYKEFYGREGLFTVLCRKLECHAWTR